ncbi:MAG TPA: circadian clock KaiB family protein [Candidatus Binatus sp.]|uniref:circadian clock KaiB family protein n=1 Tax=Candidatus Binatus sp. TaxID=2811406 RepID=UPI002F419D9C
MAKIHQFKPGVRAKASKLKSKSKANPDRYTLRLFTCGTTPRSTRAVRNLREICETDLKGNYDLEVIDIYQEPGRATESDIIAAPTLVKEEPPPVKRMVGDLSDRPKVLYYLAIAGGSK